MILRIICDSADWRVNFPKRKQPIKIFATPAKGLGNIQVHWDPWREQGILGTSQQRIAPFLQYGKQLLPGLDSTLQSCLLTSRSTLFLGLLQPCLFKERHRGAAPCLVPLDHYLLRPGLQYMRMGVEKIGIKKTTTLRRADIAPHTSGCSKKKNRYGQIYQSYK